MLHESRFEVEEGGSLHDGAAERVAWRLTLRLGHDIAAEWVAGGLALRLSHHVAAEWVAGALARGVLGVGLGRHSESCCCETVQSLRELGVESSESLK